jgi:hypothetical protein
MSRYTRRRPQGPASPQVSRLLILAYVIAAVIGLVAGVIWLVWLSLGGRMPS